jgi:glycosyltransferase involved in cell wall biosynthesis
MHNRDVSGHGDGVHILISGLSRFTQPTGICRHAANLARCLSDLPEISKITLLVGQWQEEYFRTALGIGLTKVDLVPIAITNHSLTRNYWFTFELPRIVEKYKPSIVHLGFPVPIIRSRFICPVVVTVHDLYPYDLPESLHRFNGFCKRLFFRQCMQESDAVTCVSESTRAALERRFPELSSHVPVQIVHNYADFSPSADEPPLETDPRPFLLTVAQHQPNKRLDLLFSAFAQLRRKGFVSNDLQVLVVGSTGAQSDALQRLVKSLQLDARVQWLPPLSDLRLAWLYRNCELFIASSYIEGFCLPLLEAMFFGCRIVASDIPVFHEIAGNSPVYFDISHAAVENLASAIVSALNSSPNTTRHAVRFSRDNTAAECLALYSLLLHDKLEEETEQPPMIRVK